MNSLQKQQKNKSMNFFDSRKHFQNLQNDVEFWSKCLQKRLYNEVVKGFGFSHQPPTFPSRNGIGYSNRGFAIFVDLPYPHSQGDLDLDLCGTKSTLPWYYPLHHKLTCIQALFKVFFIQKIASISLLEFLYKLHFYSFWASFYHKYIFFHMYYRNEFMDEVTSSNGWRILRIQLDMTIL